MTIAGTSINLRTMVEQVGNTRLVPIQRIANNANGNQVFGKLEGDNPAGSVKDRPAANMILRAQERGTIKPGDTLLEATSGNTGIALAMVAATLGYKLKLLMPDNMTDERKSLMMAYGAELILVTEEQGMEYARDTAAAMAERGEGLILDQFANPDNWDAHYRSTGPEKEKNPDIQIIGVQPEDGSSIPGIRRWPVEYLPKIYEPARVDRIIDVSQSDAEHMARRLAREEGILSGVSSGGALTAALTMLPDLHNAVIVTIVCDRGDRYLSSGLFPAT